MIAMRSSQYDQADLVVHRVEGPDVLTYELIGVIDEHADLSFMQEFHGRVRVDLRDLRRLNSFGVRVWMTAIDAVPRDARVELVAAPPQFVEQINMLKGFLGRARVVSFVAVYECEECLTETDHLIESDACLGAGCTLPDVSCPQCGAAMTPDVVEELFLRFLKR